MAERTVPIDFGRGVANRAGPEKTPPGYVRIAENVDIAIDGTTSRRSGYAQFATLSGAHSLWSHPELSFGLVGDASKLYRIDSSAVLTPLATGLNGAPIHYCHTPIGVYWSNGTQTGNLGYGGVSSEWGLSTPSSFQVTASPDGGLDAGTYSVTVTFVGANGTESGAPAGKMVSVPSGGGIVVATPTSPDFSAVAVRIYVTTANGQEHQYAGAVAPGAQYAIGATPRGRRLDTQFLCPFPAVRFPMLKNGRLMGAVGRRVVWSEPLRYGLFDPRKNYIQLRGDDVAMLAGPDTARFVAYIGTAKRTYVFQGESIESATLSVVAHVGVVPGSMAMVDSTALKLEGVSGWVPVWVDQRGIPYAGTDAGAVALHDLFAYPIYDSAAAVFDERGGRSRYVVSGRGGAPSPVTFSDSFVAAVVNETSA